MRRPKTKKAYMLIDRILDSAPFHLKTIHRIAPGIVYICPFCKKEKEIYDLSMGISEIVGKFEHSSDCLYLLAKSLNEDRDYVRYPMIGD